MIILPVLLPVLSRKYWSTERCRLLPLLMRLTISAEGITNETKSQGEANCANMLNRIVVQWVTQIIGRMIKISNNNH